MNMNTTRILAGLDIGNGYVKGDAQDMQSGARSKIDIPSCVAYVTAMNDIPVKNTEAGPVIADIFNNMDVSFDSPLVEGNNRRLFGTRGIYSGLSLEEFDVYSHISKCQQDLSGILVLGCMAGLALQSYWAEHNALPDSVIRVDSRIALALPIREFKKYRKQYAERLKTGSHFVTFHNFEARVRVEVCFEDVQVLAEGASAQYAVMSKGEPFMNALIGESRRLDPDFNPEITAQDVLQATTLIGVDIGEGTVNFPVFQGGKFNTDSSMTFDKGYGSILNQALDRLQDEGMPFKTRKELADYMRSPVTAMTRAPHAKVDSVVQEETVAFVNEFKMQFVKVMSRVGSYIEVCYVYGGGASPVKDVLHPALIDVAKQFGAAYPILYLDSRYSRHLNREGLFFIADQVAKSVAQAAEPGETA